MKPIAEQRLESLEELAFEEGVKHIRAFLKYEGTDQRYLNRAKLCAMTISAYSRLRASESNRMAIELAVGKHDGGERNALPAARKALKGA